MNLNNLKRSLDEMMLEDSITSLVDSFDRIILATKSKKIKYNSCNTCGNEIESREESFKCICQNMMCQDCINNICDICEQCEQCCKPERCKGCSTGICETKSEYIVCEFCDEIFCEDCVYDSSVFMPTCYICRECCD